MPTLSDDLRRQLGKMIKDARTEAEKAARKALGALEVERGEHHGLESDQERQLRNRLRAHGRQLGDLRDPARGAQEIHRLAHEVAYEHWHRMLFARFLAENHLLIEPASGVDISLAECEELAREKGEDPWALAGRFAQHMLPRIFRPDDPALGVSLPPESRRALERLLGSLPAEVFTSDDALGWTYQFWQAEKKEEVNQSGVKIGAEELPAVTQLFTEHYMVLFLFHNTIGAWWAGKVLAEGSDLVENAGSEEELRQAVRLGAAGGYDFTYLRFVREARGGDEDGKPTGPWRPAAGAFEGWPKRAAELRVLDPCCGSGHFLVEGLELLVRLRIEEERLGVEEALRAVLADNLFGLEIDPRCTQIAAFNVALAAWKLAGRPIDLPPLHIACSGLAVGASREEWLALAGGDQGLHGGMDRLYGLFEQAPELGSLIDPRAVSEGSANRQLFVADFSELQPLLARALERERSSDEKTERVAAAQGMARAAELLRQQYSLVITNVPYLTRNKQSEALQSWADRHEKDGKPDLATIFLSRAVGWLARGCSVAVVTPQNWLNLTSYARLRRRLVRSTRLNVISRLGPNAFQEMNWWAATTALCVLTAEEPHDNRVCGMDVADVKDQRAKARLLQTSAPAQRQQSVLEERPDARFAFNGETGTRLLSAVADSLQGVSTADGPRFVFRFWEVGPFTDSYRRFQGSCHEHLRFGGRESVLAYEQLVQEGSALGAAIRGRRAWDRLGVAVRQMRHLPATLYSGEPFDTNVAVILPRRPEWLPAIWVYCTSEDFARNVRLLDQKTNVTNATLVQVPFDPAHWQRAAAQNYPNGLPEPQSDDPTQWLFHGHPAKAEPHAALQVAVVRLLGYRWPPEHDLDMRLAVEAREWVERCRELDAFADGDGILCLSALRGEAPAADRLRHLLASAFGKGWSAAKERELLAAAAGGGTVSSSLEEWLRDRFFEEHCKLFHHRPFVWHVWDGRLDGFHALVSYHRLAGPEGEGRRTLQALAYAYLGEWIDRQKAEQREGREGADARLAAAQDLQAQLERVLTGEPPCDLFVRWKPLQGQPIGWEADLDYGVRLNIRPFLSAELRRGGRKGAGILRWKPKIDWSKDRGKEPQSLRPEDQFPWFWSCPGEGTLDERTDFLGGVAFDGNRWNGLHYTNAAKRSARQRASEAGGSP